MFLMLWWWILCALWAAESTEVATNHTYDVAADRWHEVITNHSSELASYYYSEGCPPVSDVLPCTCSGPEKFLLLECDRISDIYSIARAVSSLPGARHFGKFSLTNSRIVELDINVLASVQFQYILMRKNPLTRIGPEFFDSSRDSLRRIEIVHNELEKFPFKEIASFPNLEYISLRYNSLETIPDFALGEILNYKIRKIDLSFNKINHIGSNAFKFLVRLQNLDLRYNKLTVINNLAFSTIQENTKLVLNLANNKIMFISDGAFENQVFKCLNLSDNNLTKMREPAFRDILKRMAERRTGVIAVTNNRFRCTCDKVKWLVELPTLYKLPILDLECSDRGNLPLQDLTLHQLGCRD